ncbi:hypothetical protein EDB85DRAFT_415763 [Lactarius pseudohatsudake]|nr:hypothetical protein EDB85DRAFT_415763 [Lactarius pseudohatsudake]
MGSQRSIKHQKPVVEENRAPLLVMSRGEEVLFVVETKTQFKNRNGHRRAGQGTHRGGDMDFFLPRCFRLTTVLQHRLKLKIEFNRIVYLQLNSINFFNSLPRQSAHCLLVYNALVGSTSTDDELQRATGLHTDVEKWLKEVFSKAGHPDNYYRLGHIRLLDPVLQSPWPCHHPTKFNAVLVEQAHPLFALFLRMFLSGRPDDLHAWRQAHAASFLFKFSK